MCRIVNTSVLYLRGNDTKMAFKNIVEKIIGTYSERELKKIRPIMESVVALEDTMQKKTDAELRAMTDEFKKRLKRGVLARARDEAFPCSDYWWNCTSSGQNCRNENG